MAKLLSELAAHVGGQIDGDPSLQIEGLAGLSEAARGQLSFFSNRRYRREFESTRASAVLVDAKTARPAGTTVVKVDNPQLAFARLSQLFFPPQKFPAGIDARALVHAEAAVDPSATVMAGAVVERGAVVGPRAVIFGGAHVGEQARIGEGTVLHPNAVVYAQCVVGARCILHAGSVVGADGFGFAFDPGTPQHVKIPQAGIARLEDDVELGACSCVDRATLGETVVGRGTKIDNLVQIAHNVKVGPLSLLCAQAGISGSSTLGAGVVLGGQVGIAGHLELGDLAKVAAQAGVGHDIEPGGVVGGSPAYDAAVWKRASVVTQQLPDMLKELRALRRRVEELEKQSDKGSRTP
ncbi:MAG: UDP-3-O-(3-hydroxymyristoyl)glucosamine N-acyltransferase [Archangiaceae bacterium]|nr:UDP-3-O-(3-hydroxymyristoyl)glucosamine N-acyltransferase [Archangiaceae bacterium]